MSSENSHGDGFRRPAESASPTNAAATSVASTSFTMLGVQASAPTASGRLPSLRPTRDLTLGGGSRSGSSGPPYSKAPLPNNPTSSIGNSPSSATAASLAAPSRRTFVPNLNAKSRDKEQIAEKQKQAQKPKDKLNGGGKSSGNSKTKDQTDGKPSRQSHSNYVQTHSIFAEGLGGSERASSAGGRGRGFGGGGGRASTAADDSVEVKVEPVVEIRQKAERNDKGGYFIADLRQGDLHPIRIPTPLTPPISSRSAPSGVRVKEEPMELDSAAPAPAAETPADLLERCSESGEFFLLQLPSVLPHSLNQAQRHRQHGPKEAEGIEQWPDGGIGVLQVLDTGEVRLLMNSDSGPDAVAFNVSLGADVAHLQELMLLQTVGVKPDTGNLHRLGRVEHRMVCAPDIDELLSAAAASSTAAGSTAAPAFSSDENRIASDTL